MENLDLPALDFPRKHWYELFRTLDNDELVTLQLLAEDYRYLILAQLAAEELQGRLNTLAALARIEARSKAVRTA